MITLRVCNPISNVQSDSLTREMFYNLSNSVLEEVMMHNSDWQHAMINDDAVYKESSTRPWAKRFKSTSSDHVEALTST